MKNIRKKILLTKLSLETAITFKVATFRLRFRKNIADNEMVERREVVEVIDPVNSVLEVEDVESREPIVDRLDREMLERAYEGRKGINLLFANMKFLMALVTNRSGVVTLILEQYFIENKINEVTIEAFLDSPYVCFTEEENVLLRGLVSTNSKEVVLI